MTSQTGNPKPASSASDRLRLTFAAWSALVNTTRLVAQLIKDHYL
jgi:hypothetical protein